MEAIRHQVARHRGAVLLCVMMVLAKLMVPAGWMIDPVRGGPAIMPCAGTVAMPAVVGHHSGTTHGHGAPRRREHPEAPAAGMPCIFAGVSAAAIPVLASFPTAAPIALPMARVFSGQVIVQPRPRAWRPPLRAPPIRR